MFIILGVEGLGAGIHVRADTSVKPMFLSGEDITSKFQLHQRLFDLLCSLRRRGSPLMLRFARCWL
ncbi:hypothetical protein KC19_VG005100 [Ceratodon purpureus]|uniref:Uncharacterized protein n=1 Tax=Ceratodon purpureus TaxID=3225 RepID=A0A8T0HKU7_CERPU|nr:hypothetical protein KC19_VG005100 [Ceratodon purpureus]